MRENVEHCAELMQLADELGVGLRVSFLRSISDREKVWLLTNTSILLYTPAGEHFGIVPLEAMFCGTPVLAVNSGGPLETIDHGVTGWLEDGQPHAWSEVTVLFNVLSGCSTKSYSGNAIHWTQRIW